MSNHVTDEKLARIVAMSQAKVAGRIGVIFDADENGDENGDEWAKEALWKLLELGLPTRLVWSRQRVTTS
jgi:predicted nucleic acid-binding protein